jgi:hypothetical protein
MTPSSGLWQWFLRISSCVDLGAFHSQNLHIGLLTTIGVLADALALDAPERAALDRCCIELVITHTLYTGHMSATYSASNVQTVPGTRSESMKRTTRASAAAGNRAVALLRAPNETALGQANGHSQPDIPAILYGLQAMSNGDFSVRLPGDWIGIEGKIADTFNDIVAANQRMAEELKRVGHVVGKEGKTRERAKFDQSRGAWGEMEVSVNTLVDDLLRPTTEVTRAPSRRSRRAICDKPCAWMWMGGRWRASSFGRLGSSTR